MIAVFGERLVAQMGQSGRFQADIAGLLLRASKKRPATSGMLAAGEVWNG